MVQKECHGWGVDAKEHILIFVYNGADSVNVDRRIKSLSSKYIIRGAAVHISGDTVSTWKLSLELDAAKKNRQSRG